MFDLLHEMSGAMETGVSPAVAIWMNWMGLIFFASILFVWKHKAARAAFAVMLLTLPFALLIYSLGASIHLIGIAHLILWAPLAYYLFTSEIRTSTFNVKSAFGIWLVLLTGTILISLIFDVRDIYLVLMGHK
jgi:hypothetical protein